MNTQVRVRRKEFSHTGSLMPGSVVRPKVNSQAPETVCDPGEHFEESICVAAHPFHYAVEAIDRVDPTKKIETLLVLAPGADIGLRSLLSPDSPEPWMKREAGFILEDHRPLTVAFSGEKEFFFPALEIWPDPHR